MKNTIFLFVLASVLLLLNSCNNSTDPIEITDSIFEMPVVPGLIITGEDGPEAIAIWRNPHLPNGEYHFDYYYNKNDNNDDIKIDLPGPLNIRLETPFHNPSKDTFKILFALAVNTKVSLWLVKARLPEDNGGGSGTTSGGVFVSSINKIELIKDELLETGYYEVTWFGKIENGKEASSGFYRVYFKSDDTLLWCDILLARKKSDVPPELRKYIFED